MLCPVAFPLFFSPAKIECTQKCTRSCGGDDGMSKAHVRISHLKASFSVVENYYFSSLVSSSCALVLRLVETGGRSVAALLATDARLFGVKCTCCHYWLLIGLYFGGLGSCTTLYLFVRW